MTAKRQDIMLAYPFEERRLAKWKPPYIVQPKLDGVRCRAVPVNKGYVLVSSEVNRIFFLEHIEEALNNLPKPWYHLDGELYIHGQPFEKIFSITSRVENRHIDALDIRYHVFDIIVDDVPQVRRAGMLLGIPLVSPLIPVESFWANSLAEVYLAYRSFVDLGYEGMIVREASGLYSKKRSTSMMKFKPKKHDDYSVIGSLPEIDKYGNEKDELGALICSSDEGQVFHVGTGFDQPMRKTLWKLREMLPGMKVRIAYQHTTEKRGVPRFPVFMELLP